MRKSILAFSVTVALAAIAPPATVSAQNIDKAIDAYKAKDYPEAAVRFFEVLRFDTAEGNIVEAEYGMAQALLKLELPLPAIRYYENIIGAGATHPYYLKAFEGMLDAGDMLDDDLIVPAILDKKYSNALSKLTPDVLQRVHYLLGERLFKMQKRGEALDFLRTVKQENAAYPKAQYLIGLLYLGNTAGGRADYEKANEAFENVRNVISLASADPPRRNLRELATLALARTYYEMGAQYPTEDEKDPTKPNGEKNRLLRKAIDLYLEIPRFSANWGEALYERAWAHTVVPVQGKNAKGEPIVTQEFGKALGALHSIHSPYFTSGYWPESYILQSIVYYYNCHFDRVYKTLTTITDEYEPLNKVLERILKRSGAADEEWYQLLVDSIEGQKATKEMLNAGDDDLLVPARVANYLARDPQWVKLRYFMQRISDQEKKTQETKALSGGEVGNEIKSLLDTYTKQYRAVAGRWVRRQLSDTQSFLQSYLNRAVVVKLETEDAEKQWLEMGRSIDKGPRPRLPRPYIPSDQYQYFSFNQEYWADELGFYEYSIRTECYE